MRRKELPPQPARRGIYVLANDRVLDHAIALVNSIRARDAETPIVLIPHDPPYQTTVRLLHERLGVELYPNPARLEEILDTVDDAFGPGFFRARANFRKHACWFGPFDEFVYLDADTVVFERIADLMDHLERADFVSCDDQHRLGLAGVFLPAIAGAGMFPPGALDTVVGGGLFAAKKKLFTEETLFAGIREAAFVRHLLDFSRGGSEQPVLNYLVLTSVKRRLNLFHDAPGEPGMRASTPGFRRQGDVLVDRAAGRPLRYLHWAGAGIGPGYPYWSTFRHYRFLRDDVPKALQLPDPPRGLARRLTHRLRQAIRGLPKPASRPSA